MQESDIKIIQSQQDKRIYKHITLENKLQVLLISDQDTQKSGVAMNVFVGCLEDPRERQGLAHYLEHMLFLGTEKYPNQSEYMDYLSKNSGSYNAYTGLMETNYFFEIANDKFDGALDRFAQFFIKPLFTESCAEREMNAVNSEYQMYLKQDVWRQLQLLCHSAKKGNPLNKFNVGSLETLNHPNIREDLIAFYKKNYSANQMKLVVYSNQSIDSIQKLVIENFSTVPNYDIPGPLYKDLPFDNENLGNIWKVSPVKNEDYVKFWWVLDDTLVLYKNNPLSYISHLIGHEGPNSLLSVLMSEGLGLELSSGFENYMKLFSVFEINIKVTEKGLNNLNQIYNLVFQYLSILREKGVQEWIFKELQLVNSLKFENQDKQKIMSYVLSLASRLQFYNVNDVLIQPYLFEKYEPDQISKFINSLQVENMRIFIQSQSVEDQCDQTEPYYQTKFSFQQFDPEIKKIFDKPDISFKKTHKVLDLPPRNEFLPKSMEIFKDSPSDYPQLIGQDIWFKQDNTFFTPKGVIQLTLYSNDCYITSNIENYVNMIIWQKLFQNNINEISYMAEMAYLKGSCSCSQVQIDFSFSGFNDSLPNLVKQFMRKLIDFNPFEEQDLFQNILQQITKEYENFSQYPPYQQVMSYIDILFRNQNFQRELVLDELRKITPESFKVFQNKWLTNFRTEWLAVGNFQKEKILNLTEETAEILKNIQKREIQKHEVNQIRAFQFLLKKTICYERQLPPSNNNSSCTKYFQYDGQYTVRIQNKVEILVNMLKVPFFNQIRTNEQLGYVVFTLQTSKCGVGGICFLVQSDVKPPAYLAERTRVFIESFKEKIQNLTDEEFSQYVNSVKNELLDKNKDIFQETQQYQEAMKTTYLFNKKQLRIADLSEIQKEDFQKFCLNLLYDQYRSFEFYLVSQDHLDEHEKLMKTLDINHYVVTDNILSLQAQLFLHPHYYAKK